MHKLTASSIRIAKYAIINRTSISIGSNISDSKNTKIDIVNFDSIMGKNTINAIEIVKCDIYNFDSILSKSNINDSNFSENAIAPHLT